MITSIFSNSFRFYRNNIFLVTLTGLLVAAGYIAEHTLREAIEAKQTDNATTASILSATSALLVSYLATLPILYGYRKVLEVHDQKETKFHTAKDFMRASLSLFVAECLLGVLALFGFVLLTIIATAIFCPDGSEGVPLAYIASAPVILFYYASTIYLPIAALDEDQNFLELMYTGIQAARSQPVMSAGLLLTGGLFNYIGLVTKVGLLITAPFSMVVLITAYRTMMNDKGPPDQTEQEQTNP